MEHMEKNFAGRKTCPKCKGYAILPRLTGRSNFGFSGDRSNTISCPNCYGLGYIEGDKREQVPSDAHYFGGDA